MFAKKKEWKNGLNAHDMNHIFIYYGIIQLKKHLIVVKSLKTQQNVCLWGSSEVAFSNRYSKALLTNRRTVNEVYSVNVFCCFVVKIKACSEGQVVNSMASWPFLFCAAILSRLQPAAGNLMHCLNKGFQLQKRQTWEPWCWWNQKTSLFQKRAMDFWNFTWQ